MEKQNSQHFLTDADGNKVPVSEKVYTAYWQYTNREDYFMRQLKEERFHYDPERQIAEFLPSREDSLERLIEEGEEFVCNDFPVADRAVNAVFTQELMQHLDRQEQWMLYLLFAQRMTEREVSKALDIPKTMFHRMKVALYNKCRRIMGNTS